MHKITILLCAFFTPGVKKFCEGAFSKSIILTVNTWADKQIGIKNIGGAKHTKSKLVCRHSPNGHASCITDSLFAGFTAKAFLLEGHLSWSDHVLNMNISIIIKKGQDNPDRKNFRRTKLNVLLNLARHRSKEFSLIERKTADRCSGPY